MWLERKVNSVIDFRLPGDPVEIPTDVMHQRRKEYYREILGEERFNARMARRRNVGNPVNSTRRPAMPSNRTQSTSRPAPAHQNTTPHPNKSSRRSASQSGNKQACEMPDIERKGSPRADVVDEYESMANNPYFGLGYD